MKEFKILAARTLQDLQAQMNEVVKEGFDVASSITTILHPRKVSGMRDYDAWNELTIVMSREVFPARSQKTIDHEWIDPNIMWEGQTKSIEEFEKLVQENKDFKGEF